MTAISDEPPGVLGRVTTRLTRRGLAKSGGMIAAGGLLGRVELLRSAAQSAPTVGATINSLITLEAFAVTYYGAARGRSGAWEFDDASKPFVLASQCEEEAHFHFFEAAGALSATTSFTIARKDLESQRSFFAALVRLESIFVGAYMSAAREFATLGIMRLVEIAYQIGAVEAQHQAVSRLLSGERLASDRAFARWMFNTPVDAVAAIADLGYIDGSGDKFSFPGPVDRYCRGVTGLVAETMEDQPPAPTSGSATPAKGDRG
jgi:ferritin-like protein